MFQMSSLGSALAHCSCVCVCVCGGWRWGILGTRLSGPPDCYAQSNLASKEFLSVARLKKKTKKKRLSTYQELTVSICSQQNESHGDVVVKGG